MTYEQFLETLRQTPKDWAFLEGGCIRRPHKLAPGDPGPPLQYE